MSGTAITVFRFGHGRLDTRRRELIIRGQLADLQPLTFDLLAYFVANVGRVISKDELLTKVWGDSIGSDSIVARGVMKVRRALGDDGQNPRLLKTVHRVGYRLDIEVQGDADAAEMSQPSRGNAELQDPASRAIALLPCRNFTGDSTFDWVEHGVPSLVQHLAGSDVQLMLPPADCASVVAASADSLVGVCSALGAREALGSELKRGAGGFRLEVRRGRDKASAQRFAVEGHSVMELVRALSHSLVGAADEPAEPASDQSFWEEQLAKAIDLDRRGSAERALALMDECVGRLPPTAHLWLTHASMLRRVGRRDDAGKRARAALELTSDASADLLARAKFEMAAQAWAGMQPDQAAGLAEEALALASKHPAGASLVPDILSFQASISREKDDPVAGIRLAERAIAAAVAVGNRSKECHARVVLGSALLHAGLTHRAGDVLRRAADLAQRHGFAQTGAYAMRTLALLDEQVGRYALAIDEARQSAALAASVANFNLRDSARVQEIVTLVHLGRLDEAKAAAERLEATVANAWENGYSLRYARALMSWRNGEGRHATARMTIVADEGRKAGLRFANVARLEQFYQLVTLNDLPSAREALEELEDCGARVAGLQARSALLLAQGDRGSCIGALHEAAGAALLDSADSLQIDINLAWLLVEDNQWDDAMPLIGHVAESLCEGLPARILNAAYLQATSPGALADGEWETLVSAPPRLLAQCAWLLDANVAERLRGGTLRRMPELLTRMCW